MPTELNNEPNDGAANDEPKVFNQEEDEDDVLDQLEDEKEALVDEGDADTRPSTATGEKDTADKLDEKKPLSLYPDGLTPSLFSHSLFNPSFAASPLAYLSNPYAAGMLHADLADQTKVSTGLPFGGGIGLPHPLSPWQNPYASLVNSGLRYPFPGLRPTLHPSLSPFAQHQNLLNHNVTQKEETRNEKKMKKEKSKPHIKKPLNAFMLYMKEQRAKVVSECTLKESAAINQILGRKWHALSKEEQQKYYELARKEREKHMRQYPGWSARDNYGKRKKGRNEHTGPNEDYSNNDGNNAKKCRAVYGLEAQHLWCAPCRRKKKCVRYPEADNGMPSPPDHNGIIGAPSPLALAQGMLHGSPLSPQFGQGSPNGFMPASPINHLQDHHASLLQAHLHNSLPSLHGLNAGLLPRQHPFLTGGLQNMSHLTGKNSPTDHGINVGRQTPHSDGSSGGGSAGNGGPSINGTMEIKIEEVDDQLSPCVSPEPEQPMKRQRVDPHLLGKSHAIQT